MAALQNNTTQKKVLPHLLAVLLLWALYRMRANLNVTCTCKYKMVKWRYYKWAIGVLPPSYTCRVFCPSEEVIIFCSQFNKLSMLVAP